MPNSEKTDIVARGRFQQTISGNLRRKRDSIFGTRKKKFNSFLTGPVLLLNPCSIIFSVVIKMPFSRRQNTTQLHLIPLLRMSVDIRPYELMQCCLIKNREIFVCISFYGDRGSTVVKVLCYKSEDRWFDPSWCQWIFH